MLDVTIQKLTLWENQTVFPQTPKQGNFFEKISLQIEKQLSHRIKCNKDITYTKMVPFHILQNQNIIKDDWSRALLKKNNNTLCN
jgi:hypothetical protein